MMIKNVFAKMSPKSRGAKAQLLSIQLRYLIPVILLFLNHVSESEAQGAYFWSQQQRIPKYYNTTEEPPYLIADMNHTVHAFNSQPLDLSDEASSKVVVYRQWTIESSWTFPNDILFDASGGSIDLIGAAGDQSGNAHLALLMHNTDLYYSRASLSEADSSLAWSIPVLLGENSRPPQIGFERVGSIVADSAGDNIVIIYSGSQYGSGLYSVNSSDGGNSWTKPYPVYLAVDNDLAISDPKLYVGESGMVHAVWGTRNKEGHGELGYYANLDLGSNAWSEPMELDTSGLGSPSVIEYDGSIFVTYIRNDVNANLWRQSIDAGKTWTNPSRLSIRHVGSNGLVSFVVDSNDTLHGFFGQRIDNNNHGMWHTIWTGYGWTSAEAVVRGQKVTDVIGGKGFDPNSARAVIVNGNVVLATWSTDGSSGTNGVWYSYKRFDAPELASQLLPTLSHTADRLSTEVPPMLMETPGAEDTSNTIPQSILNTPQSTRNPQAVIFVGILPVLIILIGILFLRYVRGYRNN